MISKQEYTKEVTKETKICEYCLQELLSRGEVVYDRNTHEIAICDFCGEEDELCKVIWG